MAKASTKKASVKIKGDTPVKKAAIKRAAAPKEVVKAEPKTVNTDDLPDGKPTLAEKKAAAKNTFDKADEAAEDARLGKIARGW